MHPPSSGGGRRRYSVANATISVIRVCTSCYTTWNQTHMRQHTKSHLVVCDCGHFSLLNILLPQLELRHER
jgi:hypothetical protein